MVGPVTRSRNRGCTQFLSLSSTKRQNRAAGSNFFGSVEQDKSRHDSLSSKSECVKTIQPEAHIQPSFSAGSGSEDVLDTLSDMAPLSPALQPSSSGGVSNGLVASGLVPPARVMSPSSFFQPVRGVVRCERSGSPGPAQPARGMRCPLPIATGTGQPLRKLRCEQTGSSGSTQPSRGLRCPPPTSSAQPMRIMRCERPGSSNSAQPSRIMRCERPGSSNSAQPARVMRCPRPTPSTSGSAQPSRIMRCERPGSSSIAHPAQIMRCPRPSTSSSAQPVKIMKCETSFSQSSAHQVDIQALSPSCSSETIPYHNMNFDLPSSSSSKSCRNLNTLDQVLHLGSQELIFGGKDETASTTKCFSDGLENTNAVIGRHCIISPESDLSITKPQALKCRYGHQSHYSLRALKTDTTSIFQNDDSYINQLPDEVLCMIFSYLPHVDLLRVCSKVCHRWSQVTRSSTLWHNLSFCGQDIPIETVCGFIRLSPFLKSITIKDRMDVDVILPLLHQQCKRLESVNIVRCRPTDGNQKTLRAKSLYPFLRRGQLRNLNLKGTDYRSRKFYQMLGSVPSLEKLNISCSKGVTPQILGEIAKLSSLKVFKHKWHSNSIIKYYGDKSMTIQLPGRIGDWGRAYSGLFRGAGINLTTLEIYAAGISDRELSSLSSCQKLKKLAVFNANCFGSESTAAVATLPDLQELLIHNAKMTTIDLANAFRTGNLSSLKCLHLNDSVLANSDLTADACIGILSEKCPKLQHLSFTKCSSMTDVGVEAVLSHCPHLLSLDLNGGLGVSGQSFLLIPSKTPNLQLLVVEEDCSQEKNKIIKQLLENFFLKIETISTWKNRTTSFFL